MQQPLAVNCLPSLVNSSISLLVCRLRGLGNRSARGGSRVLVRRSENWYGRWQWGMSRRHKGCVNWLAECESLLVECARKLVGGERRVAEGERRLA